jgi:hypothetical protein
MKTVFISTLILTASSCALAQDVMFQTQSAPPITTMRAERMEVSGSPVVGAPYSATVTNESVQTLVDGNRIVQKSTGTTARDSEGRTRQETELPAIGNLSATNAPKLVFIHDPVAQTSYTLNLTDKTAEKMPAPPGLPATLGPAGKASGPGNMVFFQKEINGPGPEGMPGPLPPSDVFQSTIITNDAGPAQTENLGTQTMEGVTVNGVRRTRTIPAGQIGNEKPITIVTEVWKSPDLKTVVYSKRSDPRMGEQTFKLTNIVRGDPDPSLFIVPADFKMMDGPQPIIYRTKQ